MLAHICEKDALWVGIVGPLIPAFVDSPKKKSSWTSFFPITPDTVIVNARFQPHPMAYRHHLAFPTCGRAKLETECGEDNDEVTLLLASQDDQFPPFLQFLFASF